MGFVGLKQLNAPVAYCSTQTLLRHTHQNLWSSIPGSASFYADSASNVSGKAEMSFLPAKSTRSCRPMLSVDQRCNALSRHRLRHKQVRDSLQASCPKRVPQRITRHTLGTRPNCTANICLGGVGMLQPDGRDDVLGRERILRQIDV